jgi:hypothetical protein
MRDRLVIPLEIWNNRMLIKLLNINLISIITNKRKDLTMISKITITIKRIMIIIAIRTKGLKISDTFIIFGLS